MKNLFIVTAIFLITSIAIGQNSHSISDNKRAAKPNKTTSTAKIETFTFLSNGIATQGKIYLPASYKINKDLPSIYLIDFTEQHFKVTTDEFEKVIDGVIQLAGFDALVITHNELLDIDAKPETFQEHYTTFKDMADYVDAHYTNNTSRTFVGKGSEAGIVIMALFHQKSESSVYDNYIATDPSGDYSAAIIKMIEDEDYHNSKSNKRLHFSFSTSNDRTKCTQLIKRINDAKYPGL